MEKPKQVKQVKQDSYITKLRKEIDQLESDINFLRGAYSETFLVGYRDADQWKKLYDFKIHIDSLSQLPAGWKIESSLPSFTIEKSNQKVISLIGNKSKGKTFVFNLLTSDSIVELTGPTEGLCIKTLGGFKTFLDIPGGNSLNFFNESSDEMKDKGLTSKFLEQFMIEVSNIIILVVGRMTVQDLQFLKSIQYGLKGKIVIVLHNMTMITQKEDYDEFVDKKLKEYGFDLQLIQNDPPYYLQKNSNQFNNDMRIHHFILTNHHSQFYQQNCKVIEFIKTIISLSKASKQFEVTESLKWFITEHSLKYFGQAIEDEKIHCTKDMIKSDQIILSIKPHIAFFATDMVTHKIDPCYRYYYTDKTFKLQIELSNQCNDLYSDVKIVNEKYLFQIYGVKNEIKPDVLAEKKEEENNSNFSMFQYGEFLLRVSVPFSNGILANTKPEATYQDGILTLTYALDNSAVIINFK